MPSLLHHAQTIADTLEAVETAFNSIPDGPEKEVAKTALALHHVSLDLGRAKIGFDLSPRSAPVLGTIQTLSGGTGKDNDGGQ